MSGVEEKSPGALCRCFPVWPNICLICWHPTCAALTPPSSFLLLSISILYLPHIYISRYQFVFLAHTQTLCILCKCVAFFGPRGPRASPPIQCCSLYYPLYLSICPSVHHSLHPAAHLAALLASLPHTASIAALLWVTFKDQTPLLINTETAALYSTSVLSFLPSSSLAALPLSKSKVLHLLMMEAVSSHLYCIGFYIQTKDNVWFAYFCYICP